MERTKKIMMVSAVGVAANTALSAAKFIIGMASGSKAVMADGANNLGDALGSIVTIVGTRLSSKAPDREHPFGHGRIEYMTSIIVAFLVIYVGLESLGSSIRSLINGDETDFSTLSLIILAIGLGVKLILGLWTKKQGTEVKSTALIASGTDAFSDALLSFATLVSALLSRYLHIDIGGWLGILISGYILKSGLDLIKEPINSLVGERTDSRLTDEIKRTIAGFDHVEGVYDLILNMYGETFTVGSVHIQIPDSMSAREIQALTRDISKTVYRKYRVILTVGIYASNTSDSISHEIRQDVDEVLSDYPQVVQMHGFYVDLDTKMVAFDVIFKFGSDYQKLKREIQEKLIHLVPGYTFDIVIDEDFTD